jgi:hypothetical protein
MWFWYFFSFVTSSLFSLTPLVLWSGWPSVGASFWIIGQSIIIAIHFYLKKREGVSQSRIDLFLILVCGYCLFASTYQYLAALIFFPSDSYRTALATGHIIFTAVFLAFLCLVHKGAKKVKYLQRKLADLGCS